MRMHPHIPLLARDFGIIQPGAYDFSDSAVAMDEKNKVLAMDAAPTNLAQAGIITNPNASVIAFMLNYMDPEVTRVLTTPPEAAEILGEAKKGDWVMKSTTFPVIESTGETSSYGDFDNNGLSGANVNFEPRQSYTFQTFTRWGDMELEAQAAAKIDWAAEQNVSSALIMNTFQNRTYFFGVAGLDNYGLINDPSLSPAISPLASAWKSATGVQIVADIQNLFVTLQLQLQGNIEMEDDLTLVLPSTLQPYLLTPMQNVYGTPSVKAYLKEAFPKMEFKTAQQYILSGGNLVQMIAPKVQGQKTGFCAFTEKMRAHAIVRKTSSTHQKKSGGTWGAIIKVPAAIASLLGA